MPEAAVFGTHTSGVLTVVPKTMFSLAFVRKMGKWLGKWCLKAATSPASTRPVLSGKRALLTIQRSSQTVKNQSLM